MTGTGKIDDWALHAYVDGEVADDQKAEIEAFLASDEEASRMVEAWKQQKRAFHQAFDATLEEPVPASLKATVNNGGSWRARPFLAMAAALALLMIGGAGGWFLTSGTGGPGLRTIAEQAITAHRIYTAEVRHPVEVAAADRAHLQAWLSKRVGTEFVIPDLSSQGYALLGGRLLTANDKPAAQLMFEDGSRKRITIFFSSDPSNQETALQVERKGNLIACYWLDGKLGFVVAGEMDLDAMMTLAHEIYEQLES